MEEHERSKDEQLAHTMQALKAELQVMMRIVFLLLVCTTLWGYLIRYIFKTLELSTLTFVHVLLGVIACYLANEIPVSQLIHREKINGCGLFFKEEGHFYYAEQKKSAFFKKVGGYLLIEPLIQYIILNQPTHFSSQILAYRWIFYGLILAKVFSWFIISLIVWWIHLKVYCVIKHQKEEDRQELIDGLYETLTEEDSSEWTKETKEE